MYPNKDQLQKSYTIYKLIEKGISLTKLVEEGKKLGVIIAVPGSLHTCECRTDNSRFFPKLDENGKVIGGGFG